MTKSWPRRWSRLPCYHQADRITILDVGCGDGRLLNWFREMNPEKHETCGLDNDEDARRIVEGNRHRFFMGLFEDVDFGDLKFDIIASNHVIEHVSDPLGVCRKARRLLKQNGIYSFDAPNIKSWEWPFFKHRLWGGMDFIRKYLYATFDHETLPVDHKEIFKD